MFNRQSSNGDTMCMATTVKLSWHDGIRFSATLQNRIIELDSAEKMESAFTPMELFLVALVGCTSMDVQWILQQQRQKVTKLEINTRGTRRDEDPRYYDLIELEYTVTGDEIRKDAVERAIRLSQAKYCSVRAMLNEKVRLDIKYKIINQDGTEQEYTYDDSASEVQRQLTG